MEEQSNVEDLEEDQVLMLRIQRGDEAAFGALMKKWELQVKTVAARLVFNTTDAEELAQETFVQLWQHRDRFQTERPFKSWILGIAVNLARKRVRWWRRRPSISLDEWTETGAERAGTSAAGTVLLETAERAAAVQAAVAQLPTDFREALVLFEYEQMSYQEIATTLDVSIKTVENRIARARARLRPPLAGWV